MSSKKLRHFDVSIEEDELTEKAKELASQIKPALQKEGMKVKVFEDGITNKLVGVYSSKSKNKEEMVLVRVYGKKTELLVNREQELQNFHWLHEVGCAPPVFATFNNGLMYGFATGTCVTADSVRDRNISRLIAQEMARMHYKIKAPHGDGAKPACLWTKLRKYLSIVPVMYDDEDKQRRFEENIPPVAKLKEELVMLEDVMGGYDCPIVFCHNDALLNNIVYDEDKEKVTFIDYEYGEYNYQCYDIANHFAEFIGTDVDEIDMARYPDKEFQMRWLIDYMQMWSELSKSGFRQDVVEKMYVQVHHFTIVADFFWGLWALVQAKHSLIDFDFLRYGIVRMGSYFERKKRHLSVKIPKIPPL